MGTTTKFEELLDALMAENTTESVLKRAWRVAAVQFHPDRGGSGEAFDVLRKAYKASLAKLQEVTQTCAECKNTGHVSRGMGFYTISMRCPYCESWMRKRGG